MQEEAEAEEEAEDEWTTRAATYTHPPRRELSGQLVAAIRARMHQLP
jgi:hypothetical protein